MKGLQPTSSENLLPTNAQKAPEADLTTSPAGAHSPPPSIYSPRLAPYMCICFFVGDPAATPVKAAAVPSEDAATTPQPKVAVAPGDAPAPPSVLLPPPASPTRHSPKAAATVSITAP